MSIMQDSQHLQYFLMVILSVSFYSSIFGLKTASADTFDVTSYGAIGDGDTDDTDAFVRAWGDVCGDTSAVPTMIVPSAKTFLIRCVAFAGPCQSSNINIKLLGDITAPKNVDGWKGCETTGYLMHFTSVQGLIIEGPGQLDGQGSIWWPKEVDIKPMGPSCDCPSMLRFENCDGLQIRGTRHINSPKSHISIKHCDGADLGYIYISAPEHSPNTDGIDVSWSSHVNIHDSHIQSGDDCVAISGGTFDINITSVLCGPSHGISIGSLGKNGAYSTVERVRVQNCNITGTQNGVRIKTSPNGKGFARSIVFEDIHFKNVNNPIIIDQHYCNKMEDAFCPSPPTASAVKVSGVTYRNIHGSSASKQAITLNCSDKYKCNRILMNKIRITGKNVFAYCYNVHGKFMNTTPQITCH